MMMGEKGRKMVSTKYREDPMNPLLEVIPRFALRWYRENIRECP
jgi:hypothetical protein